MVAPPLSARRDRPARVLVEAGNSAAAAVTVTRLSDADRAGAIKSPPPLSCTSSLSPPDSRNHSRAVSPAHGSRRASVPAQHILQGASLALSVGLSPKAEATPRRQSANAAVAAGKLSMGTCDVTHQPGSLLSVEGDSLGVPSRRPSAVADSALLAAAATAALADTAAPRRASAGDSLQVQPLAPREPAPERQRPALPRRQSAAAATAGGPVAAEKSEPERVEVDSMTISAFGPRPQENIQIPAGFRRTTSAAFASVVAGAVGAFSAGVHRRRSANAAPMRPGDDASGYAYGDGAAGGGVGASASDGARAASGADGVDRRRSMPGGDEMNSEAFVKNMMRAFNAWDANGDGSISREEVRNLMRFATNDEISDDMIDRLLEVADTDHSGGISFEEFSRWLCNPRSGMRAHINIDAAPSSEVAAIRKAVKGLFKLFDADNDGYIDRAEFELSCHGVAKFDGELETVKQFQAMDRNKDSRLCWEEFYNEYCRLLDAIPQPVAAKVALINAKAERYQSYKASKASAKSAAAGGISAAPVGSAC
eukprot:TRINITY_DN56046_c0_g1_i1.p1 TRINITY_DN56046_c0_g1~~TRINITY_DN56046_c0_g1_i1.p1  ORF type:complete len:539 (+),score=123.03 TRINITY_DN56046_c0_g1_i1:191-1807(+)